MPYVNISDVQYFDSIKWKHPAVAVLLMLICILTITGNCLVVITICMRRYLQNPTGYLIASLAVADLIVGLVVMPLNSLFEMTRPTWMLGLLMCDLFHAFDVLASSSSIWNLCIISLDRFMAGYDPIGYRDRVSTKRISIAICFVWIMSACLSFPAIAWWHAFSPEIYVHNMRCVFTDDKCYVLFSNMVSFYIPLVIILFAYGNVFLIATRHANTIKHGSTNINKHENGIKSSEMVPSGMNISSMRIHFGKKNIPRFHTQLPVRSFVGGDMLTPSRRFRATRYEKSLLAGRKEASKDCEHCSKHYGIRAKTKHIMRRVHEQRAARTLSIVVGTFILCWTPFFVFASFTTICKTCISDHDSWFTIFTWTGHLNSMLNPLIYSRFSRDFRHAFKQILTCGRLGRKRGSIREPLGVAFAQLVSITQLWEQRSGYETIGVLSPPHEHKLYEQ